MYDIVGDIHGHFDALSGMVRYLGYRRTGGTWRAPDGGRQLLFLGDFVDRGPRIRETVRMVRQMMDDGVALSVMGNHEYNAVAWHTPDGHGGWLRSHSSVHRRQHAATLQQYGMDPRGDEPPSREFREDLEWMRRLPLYCANEHLIVVHAAWEEQAVKDIRSNRHILVDDEALYRSAYGENRESRTVEILLKGVELPLPDGRGYLDKEGTRRFKTRVRWWLTDHRAGRTMGEIAMPPADTELADISVPLASQQQLPGYHDERPVFLGHYWLTGTPLPLAPRIACLDYSVAKGGVLCGYRWNGESTLLPGSFCTVNPAGEVQLTLSLR